MAAYPVAWFGNKLWLEGFADKVSVSPLTFIAASIIGHAIGWLSILYKTLKAAGYNPSKALRYK